MVVKYVEICLNLLLDSFLRLTHEFSRYSIGCICPWVWQEVIPLSVPPVLVFGSLSLLASKVDGFGLFRRRKGTMFIEQRAPPQ